MPLQLPLVEESATTCDSVFDVEQNLQPVRDAINQLLPVWDSDVSLLTGGLQSVNAVHEMLMHTKKRLAVGHYSEMAARLVTPGCFNIWLLHGVQLAAAGSVDTSGKMAKITELKGPVTLVPIYKAAVFGDSALIEQLFTMNLPLAFANFYARLKTKFGTN
jgi:hypothetical protein